MEVHYDPVELGFGKRSVEKVRKHLSLVRCYMLLVPCICPMPLFQKQETFCLLKNNITIDFWEISSPVTKAFVHLKDNKYRKNKLLHGNRKNVYTSKPEIMVVQCMSHHDQLLPRV